MRAPAFSVKAICCCLAVFWACFGRAAEIESTVIQRSNPHHYIVRADVQSQETRGKAGNAWITVLLPLPTSNQYQDVNRLSMSEGEVLKYADSGEDWEYLTAFKKILASTLSWTEATPELTYQCEVTLYDVTADFSKIKTMYPQPTDRYPFPQYTKSYRPYILPGHRDIFRMSRDIIVRNELQEEDQLGFAFGAFNHVVEAFRLVPQGEDDKVRKMREILKTMGGTSCELSSVFVALMRSRNIPARHLVGMRLDGTPHVLAEFYLHRYGWIPVDIAMQKEDLRDDADYFGNMKAGNGIVILNGDLGLTISPPRERRQQVPMLQTYRRWPEPGKGSLGSTFYLFRTVTQGGGEGEEKQQLVM